MLPRLLDDEGRCHPLPATGRHRLALLDSSLQKMGMAADFLFAKLCTARLDLHESSSMPLTESTEAGKMVAQVMNAGLPHEIEALRDMPARRLSLVGLLAGVMTASLVGCSGPAVPPAGGPLDVISPYDVRPELSTLQGPELARASAQQKLSHLVAKYGVEAVVGVLVEPFSPDDNRVLQDRLRTGASQFEQFSQWEGGRAVAYVAPVTGVEAFAANLELGEYQVELERRIVRVQGDSAKFAEHAANLGPGPGGRRSP
jgi:hypothetical protein